MSTAENEIYPPEVQAAVDQLRRLTGVVNVYCDILDLAAVRADDLSSIAYAQYPVASLRRTGGGRADEGLLQIKLEVSRDDAGWRAIEFLAWFIRDRARSGMTDEMRLFALPPVIGHQVQMGQSLQFLIELFQTESSDGAPLRRMREFADSLKLMVDLYQRMLIERGDRGFARAANGLAGQ